VRALAERMVARGDRVGVTMRGDVTVLER
jgi:hypothetical protein